MKYGFFLTVSIFCAIFAVCAVLSSTSNQEFEQSNSISCRKCNRPTCKGCNITLAGSGCFNCTCQIHVSFEKWNFKMAGCGCRDRDHSINQLMACKSCGGKKRKHPGYPSNIISCKWEYPMEGTVSV